MYMQVKKSIALLSLSILLSACGGAPADESTADATVNKPTLPSSIKSSSPQSSATQSIKSSVRASSSSQATLPGTDITPPSTTILLLQKISETSITLKWDHATDNTAVASYKIERDGNPVATLESPTYSWSDKNLLPYTEHTYTIRALDAAGNPSAKSTPLVARTLATTNSNVNLSSNSSISSTKSASESSSSGMPSSGKSSSTSSSVAQKTVTLSWSHPDKRENGQFLELDEIGGYELRFKTSTNGQYIYFTLNGNTITSYSTNLIPDDSDIQIAVFDTTGLYSDFISISPTN